MMRLENLYEDFELAREALSLYEFNEEKTEQYLDYFRISSNAVYPFSKNGRVCFLRISPISENSFHEIKGEIELLKYLKSNNFNAMEVVLMKDGRNVSIIDKNYQKYIVCAFFRVEGESFDDYLEENKPSNELMFNYGKMIATYHNLVKDYLPVFERRGLEEFLNKIESNLDLYSTNNEIKIVFLEMKKQILSFPRNKNNYGLIHYDMELDNVFYSPILGFSVIDFDDAHYSFYNMDVVRVVNEIKNNVGKEFVSAFLEGYKSEKEIDESISFDVLSKISFIQHYAEIKYVLSSEIENKPEWMKELIESLNKRLVMLENIILEK